jgi:hypothetical protein
MCSRDWIMSLINKAADKKTPGYAGCKVCLEGESRT